MRCSRGAADTAPDNSTTHKAAQANRLSSLYGLGVDLRRRQVVDGLTLQIRGGKRTDQHRDLGLGPVVDRVLVDQDLGLLLGRDPLDGTEQGGVAFQVVGDAALTPDDEIGPGTPAGVRGESLVAATPGSNSVVRLPGNRVRFAANARLPPTGR